MKSLVCAKWVSTPLSALLLLLLACSNSPTTPVSTQLLPGDFSLTHMTNLGKRLAAGSNSSSTLFLDTVSNTASYYFLLENKGDFDITGIKVTSDNPAFVFSPDSLDVLMSRQKTTLLPIFKLTVTHGKQPSGIGYTTLLDTGMNVAEITFTGTTQNAGGAHQQVTLQAGLSAYAKLVDLNFYDGARLIDLTHAVGSATGYYPGIHDPTTMPIYNTDQVDSITVENMGNVAVGLSWWPSTNSTRIDLEIGIGAKAKLSPKCLAVEIDCRGVIAVPTKFEQDPDGYIQFNLM